MHLTSTVTTGEDTDDDQYGAFLASLQTRYDAAMAGGARLFTTTATGLFDAFLAVLPEDRRQHYKCHACKRFVERFGGLVTISLDGAVEPIMWNCGTVPLIFRSSVNAMSRAVVKARVTGVFLCEEKTWGMPNNKSAKPPYVWRHMAVVPPASIVHKPSPIQSTEQAAAEKLQEYEMLCRGLDEFPIEIVRQAHALLTTGNLYRSEKCIGVAKWLLELHEARAETENTVARDNMVWLAVASAPAGFCHIRSGMIGTLLEDIAAGLEFADIKAKFDAKMNPLLYQRPQAAPSAGNIAQAEKIVASLKAAGALDRRFATLDDIQALWKPKAAAPKPEKAGGVFCHLKPKATPAAVPIDQPPVTMTWEKFQRVVLPGAEVIEFYVPTQNAPYAALVTAANPDAPPILQWDREEKRNPVSWYLYHGGSQPEAWNLRSGVYHPVTAIALQPSMWDRELAHQGAAVFVLLDGARDTRRDGGYSAGGGFFPECLRSEYHGVRSTMEAYARSAIVAGSEQASACGIKLEKGSPWNYLFRVASKGVQTTYKLDRWD